MHVSLPPESPAMQAREPDAFEAISRADLQTARRKSSVDAAMSSHSGEGEVRDEAQACSTGAFTMAVSFEGLIEVCARGF